MRYAGLAALVLASAATAASAATLALGTQPTAAPATPSAHAEPAAAKTVTRFFAALRAQDWPGACTLVREQIGCLAGLAAKPVEILDFDVVATIARRGRAVASVTVDGAPGRVTLVRADAQWFIASVSLSSRASAGRAPAGSTAPGA